MSYVVTWDGYKHRWIQLRFVYGYTGYYRYDTEYFNKMHACM